MPALIQPAMEHVQLLKRALEDPNTAASLLHLIARKSSSKKGKSKKIKGGAIAGIVIAIVVVIIIAVIVMLLLRRRASKRKGIQAGPQGAPAVGHV